VAKNKKKKTFREPSRLKLELLAENKIPGKSLKIC
jgi:hypothetical protein